MHGLRVYVNQGKGVVGVGGGGQSGGKWCTSVIVSTINNLKKKKKSVYAKWLITALCHFEEN